MLISISVLYTVSLRYPHRFCSDKSPLREWDPGPAMRSAGVLPTLHQNHRIYRVPGFHSSCTIWALSLPHPQECCSFLLWVQGGRQTRLRVRGWGNPNSKKGQSLLYSMTTKLCHTPYVLHKGCMAKKRNIIPYRISFQQGKSLMD